MKTVQNLRSLLDTAKAGLSIQQLWEIMALPGNPSRNPTFSPFRDNHDTPAFSIYEKGQKFKDHGTGEGGDQIDFLMLASPGASRKEAIERFLTFAGLGEEEWRSENEEAALARERAREQASYEADEKANLAGAASTLMPTILENYAWEEVDAWESSQYRLEGQPVRELQNAFLANLFCPQDIVWLGEPTQSGDGRETDSPAKRSRLRRENAAHFKTVREWMQEPELPGPMLCPHTFRPGSYSRGKASVATTPYLVCDIDTPFRFQCATGAKNCTCECCKPIVPERCQANILAGLAVTNWLATFLELDLRAIVHTGNKSVHSFFVMPPPAELETLRTVAPALGIDPSLFDLSHPCRMPGFPHEKSRENSRLLLLNLNPALTVATQSA